MEEFLITLNKCLPKKWRIRTKPSGLLRKIEPNRQVIGGYKSRLRNWWRHEASFHLWEGERYDQLDVIVKVLEPPDQEVYLMHACLIGRFFDFLFMYGRSQ